MLDAVVDMLYSLIFEPEMRLEIIFDILFCVGALPMIVMFSWLIA